MSVTSLASQPKLAVTDPATGVTFGPTDLVRGVSYLSAYLSRLPSGARIAVEARHDVLDVMLLMACLRSRRTFVPVDPSHGPVVRQHIIKDCAPAKVLLGADREDLKEATLAVVRDGVSEDPDHVPDSPAVTDPDFILYTSGTSARPKGVMFHREQTEFIVSALCESLAYPRDVTIHSRLPLTFDYGLFQVMLAHEFECDLVLANPISPFETMSMLERSSSPVVLPIVPRMMAAIGGAAARRRSSAQNVVLVTSTGEALTHSTLQMIGSAFPEAQVQAMYGLTECKRVSIGAPFRGMADNPGNVGPPLPGTTARVRDPEGCAVPAGVAGEVWVGGPHLSAGYWNDIEETALRFVTDPLTGERELRTGDRGVMNADGTLCVLGRSDAIVKHRGVRISLREIEGVAADQPGVGDVVAFHHADSLYVAYVGEAKERLLTDELRRLLGERYTPLVVIRVPNIPLTGRGKADYSTLLHILRIAEA